MSALLGYGWMDRTAYWAWVAGMVMGGFLGVLLGQWMVWLLLRNPLGLLFRACRKVRRDIVHLCATGRLRPGRLARGFHGIAVRLERFVEDARQRHAAPFGLSAHPCRKLG